MERGLIASYEVALDRLTAGLSTESLPLAVRIAEIPQQIRGYVATSKDASVATAKAAEAEAVGAVGRLTETGAAGGSC
ncbi:DUF6537 domain-containing protein [Caulobacter segnis]